MTATIDDLILRCVERKIPEHPWLCQLHGTGDRVYATNGWCLLSAPAKLLSGRYSPVPGFRESAYQFLADVGRRVIAEVPIIAIREALAAWEIDGDSVTLGCDTGDVKLLGAFYNPTFLLRLCNLADAIQEATIVVNRKGNSADPLIGTRGSLAFWIGDVQGMLMPKYWMPGYGHKATATVRHKLIR